MKAKQNCLSTIALEKDRTRSDEFRSAVIPRDKIGNIFTTQAMTRCRYWLRMFPVRITLDMIGLLIVFLAIVLPRSFIYRLLYPIFRLVFGTLYPAYASYKAVRTKNVKEYVKWMMYWIVFALFTCAETFTDVFFSFWFPFYYEIKIILVLWLLSPATKGSSILYRRFVHPALIRREAEIDDALARATEQGYTAVLHLGTKSVNYATTVLMQTAIKNFSLVFPSALPGRQSVPAISSLANRNTTERLSITDELDNSIQTPNDIERASFDDPETGDEEYGHVWTMEEYLEALSTDSDNEPEQEQQMTFKLPDDTPIRIRKPRKRATVIRQQKNRACKSKTVQNYDMDFSDVADN